MYPKLLSLYGPLELNSYNIALAISIGLFLFLVNRHPSRATYISTSDLINLFIESALAGIIGGRILHVLGQLSEYPTLFSIIRLWDGGLSILGAFLAVFLFTWWRLGQLGIPFIIGADMASLYAPLIHSIGRIGCFLVGCCHGSPTQSFFSITYTHPQVVAPLHVPLYPAQLYSSLFFIIIFMGLYLYAKKGKPAPGTMTLLYILGMSLERFLVDFVRGDRILISSIPHLSFHQLIAALLFIGALGMVIVRQQVVHTHESL
jgi:phosphatidylglycerol:prolipoprotein diacylglycerol transferase